MTLPGLFNELNQRKHLGFRPTGECLLPLFRRQLGPQVSLDLKMRVPTIQRLETREPEVFLAAVRKGDLVAQPGASDLGARLRHGPTLFRLFSHYAPP
jgi:hypothetical protein